MPSSYTYPGVYIEEVPSGVHPIASAATSNTAFVGFFPRGPFNKAVFIDSFESFVRIFGGLERLSETSYAIQQYYLNGGQIAYVVRVASGNPQAAVGKLMTADSAPSTALKLEAASPGEWGKGLWVAVSPIPGQDRFNLVVREVVNDRGELKLAGFEIHRNLSLKTPDAEGRFVKDVLEDESDLVRAISVGTGSLPADTSGGKDITSSAVIGDVKDTNAFRQFGADPDDPMHTPNDGNPPGSAELIAGVHKLDEITPEIFNILCLPRAAELADGELTAVYADALKYCRDKRAFLLIDIPSRLKASDDIKGWMATTGDGLRDKNSALYFPRLVLPDPLNGFRDLDVASSGSLAGIYARTDAERGVWKAPAGTEAMLRNASIPKNLGDLENGTLNQIGVNVLRTFPIYGPVSWGGRTLDGSDQKASEWKYIPVRRTALFIEESLYQGLKWVVFEPNDEKLWSQIRLNVGSFMHGLFRQGAFQGTSPREAYLVKCDRDTTTQADINLGIVNIVVGFAPLKPAEFVIIRIQQIAGQTEA